jgi:hypothetical protein
MALHDGALAHVIGVLDCEYRRAASFLYNSYIFGALKLRLELP